MIQNDVGVFGHEGYNSSNSKFYEIHVILKTITRTRTLKGGGFGLTPLHSLDTCDQHLTLKKNSYIKSNI